MAYRRRTRGRTFRRRRGRSLPWYARKYNAMQLASAAWRGVRYVKGLVNSEMFHNTIDNTNNPTPLGTIVPLTNIAIGDSAVTRTGNSLFVRSIVMNMNCSQNASALIIPSFEWYFSLILNRYLILLQSLVTYLLQLVPML